jgi:hypothetical protein
MSDVSVGWIATQDYGTRTCVDQQRAVEQFLHARPTLA